MSEPSPRETKTSPEQGAGKPSTGPAPTPKWRSDLHRTQKTSNFEDGDRATRPPAEAGRKPVDKYAALQDELTQTKGELADTKGELAHTKGELAVMKEAQKQMAEREIHGQLRELEQASDEARVTLTQLEAGVELTLVADDAQRLAGKAFDNTVKDYKAAQMPTVLDFITAVLDMAANLKNLRSAAKAIGQAAGDSKLGDVAGAALDVTRGGVSSVKSTSHVVKAQDKAYDGDRTSAMAEAVSAKVDANQQGDEAMKQVQFGSELFTIQSAMMRARDRREAIATKSAFIEAIGGPSDNKLDLLKIADLRLKTLSGHLESRLTQLRRLINARDPRRGGGGELGKGTQGRSIFDLIATQTPEGEKTSDKFWIKAATKLVVHAKNERVVSEKIEQTGFWLDSTDSALLGVIGLQLAPHAHLAGSRPTPVSTSAFFVPLHIGRPLSTLVTNEVLSYEQVELRGSSETATIPRPAWEDDKSRTQWLRRVTFAPYSEGSPITFGGH